MQTVGAIILIGTSIVSLIYTIWDLKARKIHRMVPTKDWKIIRVVENFGLPRHEVITPERHPYVYWFVIIRDVILAIFIMIGGLFLLFS